MVVEMIVAMSENRVIGVNNDLPWHLSEDLKHFKKVTMGKPIVMGRKTFESIGRALPGRTNVVLTSDPAYLAPGCVVVNSVEEALEIGKSLESLMIIGGAKVYEQFLEVTDVLHITQVHTHLEGDAFFPALDAKDWDEQVGEHFEANETHAHAFTFKTLNKIKTSQVA